MAEERMLSLTFPEPDIAVLTLDDPNSSANVLSTRVLDELEAHLDFVDQRGDVQGLVIRSGKPGMFIAGADLKEFVAWIDSPVERVTAVARRGQQLFGRLAAGKYVTVAAIDGVCLGGGAELTIWCDRRVMSRSGKTSYGFPEVKLGLFPGWGGTVRTPRIAGLSNAVELVTGGESIDADTAKSVGLADDVVTSSDGQLQDTLLSAAIRMVRAEQQIETFLTDRRRWAAPIAISDTELGFLGATASAYIQSQTKGHYPAPLAALEVLLGGAGLDAESACELEASEFSQLFGSPINRALLNVFFLRDRNRKDPGVRGNVQPIPIRAAGVVGAGIMGQGIAAANVKHGIPVAITDERPEALALGVRGILEEVSYNKQTKSADVRRALELAPMVNGTTLDEELCAADIVIEAIVENSAAKRQLYARLEPKMAAGAILCSNTSTIPITHLADDLERPEEFCGVHFFNPVRKMPLVEVIRGAKSSDRTVATAVAYAKALGKSPIVIGDGPGFLVNRLLLPYMNEAALLLSEGAGIRQIDKAATAFGMPMGPIALFDVVGLDTSVHAGNVMQAAFPDRVVLAEIVQMLVTAGRLGQKNGRGFFDYDPDKKGRGIESPVVTEMIQSTISQPREHTAQELTERLFLPMLVEATRVIEDGLLRDIRDIDLALIFGIGFPPFKGGLLFWADTLGAAKILEMLKPYESLGERFSPTITLKSLARTGSRFYDLPGPRSADEAID
jgi:3-hydroxyacyl-CoA dehydrogenase/enoyl-CoA hydratase/3-hydroxybutyryl-CoA epimerase/3-hydroxyacyl-CoA dehydrogenase/enoyl-CoA hydratase/3-hydroxybutyryl-CoA epimerase/enoyl-CoA isomerase